ncbi:hypothetical protein DL96DRAFT_1606033 [Flagelloscypha sp. PMI_526]|nr:hypothetical protein DL96DRAFT_1606033 [Flagelloscypha sp. PMI_526]
MRLENETYLLPSTTIIVTMDFQDSLIDDLLPDVTSSNFRDNDTRMDDTDSEPLLVDELTRHWLNERHCPEILPIQNELLDRILDRIRQQSGIVNTLQSDPVEAEKEHMRLILVQIEIERVKFVVRSYVRTRLYKIEKYARHLLQNEQLQTRLSEAERDYASRHANLTDRHFFSSVLQSLPEAQATLDDTPIFTPSIIPRPDKALPVFAHALKACPDITLKSGKPFEMEEGHISLIPYDVIENLVLAGDIELV